MNLYNTINVGSNPVSLGIFIGPAPQFVPNPIPTLSEWGFIAFAALIGLAAVLRLRRRIAVNA